jgi:hypothetical protein
MESVNHPKELPQVTNHHGQKPVKSIYKTTRYRADATAGFLLNNSSSFNAKGEKVQYFANNEEDMMRQSKLINSFQNKDSNGFMFSREEDAN